MPPHNGHLHLIEFARRYSHRVTVVVGSLASEPIPGALRYQWMSELFPDLEVVHLTDENPQYPDEHPDFWEIWKRSLRRAVSSPVDLVFCSEPYGEQLAGILGAKFIPTNEFRTTVDISASRIREDVVTHWSFLPGLVQRQLQKRILIFGPESSGKTTLAGRLAEHYGVSLVPEYARTWLPGREHDFGVVDMEIIARGQWASEEATALQSKPYLFCDTDPLTTALWCDELFSTVPESIPPLISKGRYELTLLLEPDLPWQPDPLRFRPDTRREFFEKCRQALVEHGRAHVVIKGRQEERFEAARREVDRLKFI